MIQIPQFLTSLLAEARVVRASDIHIQPYPVEYKIRFRIDGLIEHYSVVTLSTGVHLISRIKVLAHLDVAQRRRPQDGTFTFEYEQGNCDIRVATFPTIHGEKVVLRILDRVGATSLPLDQLGIEEIVCTRIQEIVAQNSGFLLVTGSTGSGKTTTVHALLSTLDVSSKNIVTLEDPVEYALKGITQTRIHPEIGLTFEEGLRSLLRQDPDVIMVGEIRDRETAQVAVQAALTGHQVVSTLHTTDALGALMRLSHMGIERYLLAGSIKALIAQQLVRRICSSCCYTHEPTPDQIAILQRHRHSLPILTSSKGCSACRGTGYKGRVGIFQLLELSPSLSSLFVQGADYKRLNDCALELGMCTLRAEAFRKLGKGIISFTEYLQID